MDSILSVGISKVINGNISDYDPRHSPKNKWALLSGGSWETCASTHRDPLLHEKELQRRQAGTAAK